MAVNLRLTAGGTTEAGGPAARGTAAIVIGDRDAIDNLTIAVRLFYIRSVLHRWGREVEKKKEKLKLTNLCGQNHANRLAPVNTSRLRRLHTTRRRDSHKQQQQQQRQQHRQVLRTLRPYNCCLVRSQGAWSLQFHVCRNCLHLLFPCLGLSAPEPLTKSLAPGRVKRRGMG